MPELPEVEVTRRGISAALTGAQVRAVRLSGKPLRWPAPADLAERLAGRRIEAVERRGKYLLLAFAHGWLIIHLGMSGHLQLVDPAASIGPWDHFDLEIVATTGQPLLLRLTDPRRFGAVLWHDLERGPVHSHILLASLGIEPFDPAFTGEWLHARLAGRKVSIKQALLAGDVVVGVGNIYASEALFRARIRPTTAAGRISLARCERLADAVKATLTEAIAAGGSTLRDFRGSDGKPGYFQHQRLVYDREGQPCRVCGTPIRALRQGQRSTYWCSTCQR
ncbi:bifunctional DNA-formamidopyrimidine glycosylase/DNA-(apurinic or apyrimidinic site) lyase [soil metagenome]